mmetsp:Transcript_8958/g.13556  ORF Transcript_8958/g.13556 Transcript_8958/m.13556 type:complete len:146 (-) Transcript_8958:81-518(-)
MDHLSQEQKNVFRGIFNFLAGEGKKELEKEDIKKAMRSLHLQPTDKEVSEMMKEAGSDTIDFTNFCNLMGNRLRKLDHRDDIAQAFECFDTEGTGVMSVEEFRSILLDGGEFSEREVRELTKLAGPTGDNLPYMDLIDKMLGSLG